MKHWIKDGIMPIIAMIMILVITNEIYMVEGNIDYFRLWFCVGIPFGIMKARTLWVPTSIDLADILGTLLLYFAICGFFGGFIAVFMMIQALIILIGTLIQAKFVN